MKTIDAPNEYPAGSDIFMGGGISNCPDWQSEIIEMLSDRDGIILNPRRHGEYTEDIASEQIEWEYHALRSVKTVFFWFPKETLCPITLFELGVFTQMPDVKLIVGTHPEYARRFDVIKQLELARPEVDVQVSLRGMANEYHWQCFAEEELDEAKDPEPKYLITCKGMGASLDSATTKPDPSEYVQGVVLDEMTYIAERHGTYEELLQVLAENYKGISEWDIMTVVSVLLELNFSIRPDGVIVAVAH